MSPTEARDKVAKLAKTATAKAAQIAEKIDDPWFQAQAWAHVARYANDPVDFAKKAAKAAARGKDDYQRSAVRAWEIVALAERGFQDESRTILTSAIAVACSVDPLSSRAESLFLLFQAAFKVSKSEAIRAADVFRHHCPPEHWRAKRALKNIAEILQEKYQPREFFW